jgi:hypothetical protein
MTCITYLCQSHHDPDVSGERLSENVLAGLYAFHDYSYDTWFELVQRYTISKKFQDLDTNLINLLHLLSRERNNENFTHNATISSPPKLECFKSISPDIYEFLCDFAEFRHRVSGGDYSKREGKYIPSFPSTHLECVY